MDITPNRSTHPTATCSTTPPNGARRQTRRPLPRGRGFILIFVLWITIGASVFLAQLLHSLDNKKVVQELGSYPLHKRELYDGLAYLIAIAQNAALVVHKDWVTSYHKEMVIKLEKYQTEKNRLFNSLKELLKNIIDLDDLLPTDQPFQIDPSLLKTEKLTLNLFASSLFVKQYNPSPIPYQLSLNDKSTISVTVQYAGKGKLNPNLLEEATLKRLFLHLGLSPQKAPALAATLADWKDPDIFPRGLNTEGTYLHQQQLHHQSHNTAFSSIGQALFLKNSSIDLVAFLQTHFSPYNLNKLQPNTLSPSLLSALTNLPPNVCRTALNALKIDRTYDHLAFSVGTLHANTIKKFLHLKGDPYNHRYISLTLKKNSATLKAIYDNTTKQIVALF